MIRLFHLSDIHFGAEHVRALEATTQRIADDPPDVLVISGDITQNGAVAEFASASDWLAALPGPKLIVPGNHDTPYLGLADRLIRPFARFEDSCGPADGGAFVSEALNVYGANTARGVQLRWNWSKGAISRGQTRLAVARLTAAAPGALRVFVAHHPLMEAKGTPMTGRVRGGRHAVDHLAAAGVDVILTGHVHTPFVQAFPLLGDGRTYAVGASTLSIRTRGAAPGFNCIEVDDRTIKVTALGWTGAGLETQEIWSVPRRDLEPLSD